MEATLPDDRVIGASIREAVSYMPCPCLGLSAHGFDRGHQAERNMLWCRGERSGD